MLDQPRAEAGDAVTIRLDGAAALIAKFTRLAQFREAARALNAAALHVKGKIAQYPAESHRPQPFVSDKQRRGLFAKLRKGEIEVPYRRGASPGSQSLGRKWTIASSNNGLTVTVGNNVSYGPLVQGEKQTGYHATTGWRTVEQVMDAERETVVEYVSQELQRIVND